MARDGRLWDALVRSLSRLAQGYGLSVLIGVPLGLVMGRAAIVRRSLRPLVVGLQALPSICWLPLALLWFGLTETSIIFVVVMGSVLAIAISVEDGVMGVDPLLLRMSATYGVRGPRLFAGVLLPAALPSIVTGLKLGWSFAWRALMAGELLYVSGGLGQLLTMGRELMEIPQVMAVMVCIIAVGTFIDRVLFQTVELRIRRRWGLAAS
ncbi:sulfate ABC transporter permease [Melittangium boletus DSM 14713]|uniref:Sulfate ABC transporter permease n=2 Tax=Melittangium boletus TaxID=83453 RepID=A0A250IGZ5_9BACT|nr:ABC transporter permease [Melittangium boletus]ATB30431.1 sulfate ABC transporter permease [Melittangium boletus DSM 14713]